MRVPLHIGLLRDRVGLTREALVDDGKGGQVVTRVALRGPASFPAQVEPLRSEERLRQAATEAGVAYRVLLRYHPEVTASTRVTWGTRTLEVVGPPITHGHQHLIECLCQERTV